MSATTTVQGVPLASFVGQVAPQVVTAPFAALGTVTRSILVRAAELINVKDFGAPGSAGGDSAPGINAALAYVRGLGTSASARVVFPADTYTVASPLDFTGLLSENILIEGCGSRIVASFDGGIVVDAFNSRWLRLRDLSIGTDGTHTPQLGFAAGRVNSAQNADCHVFENIIVDGDWTLAAAYFIGTETSAAKNCKFWNGIAGAGTYGLIVDGINHFAVSSSFAAQTLPADTPISFNEMLFLQADVRNGGGTGHGIWIGGAARHRFVSSYVEVNSATQAVVLYSNTATSAALNSALYFDLHQETTAAADVFLIDGAASYALIYGLFYNDHNAQATNSIFKCSPAVTSVNAQGWEIRIISTGVARIFDNPAVWSQVAGDVLLPNSAAPWNLTTQFIGRLIAANQATIVANTLDTTGAGVLNAATANTTTLNVAGTASLGSATIGGAAAAVRPTITVFNSSGSWTPKATSTSFWALLSGGGGGGGGGASATTAQTASGGGGGGGGGCFVIGPVPIMAFSGALTVTVGAPGSGGAAGANGSAGGASYASATGFVSLEAGGGGGGGFGSVSVSSAGGGGGSVAPGSFATGGNASGAVPGSGGIPNGQSGVAGTYVPYQTGLWAGGGGAGTTSAGVSAGAQSNLGYGATGGNSGQGVAANQAVAGVANSGATLTASGNAGYGAAGLPGHGSGGSGAVGGAAGVANGAGQAGGVGGGPGGGGGGGGASAGGAGGAGGNGAPGQVIIIEV